MTPVCCCAELMQWKLIAEFTMWAITLQVGFLCPWPIRDKDLDVKNNQPLKTNQDFFFL